MEAVLGSILVQGGNTTFDFDQSKIYTADATNGNASGSYTLVVALSRTERPAGEAITVASAVGALKGVIEFDEELNVSDPD